MGVTEILQGGVTEVLQGCYRGVTKLSDAWTTNHRATIEDSNPWSFRQ